MVRDGLFLVRIYGEKHNDHWALVSLDFGVAAQGKTVEEALSRLDEQIKEYIYDATVGEDKEFEKELLSRKAPLEFLLNTTGLISRKQLQATLKTKSPVFNLFSWRHKLCLSSPKLQRCRKDSNQPRVQSEEKEPLRLMRNGLRPLTGSGMLSR